MILSMASRSGGSGASVPWSSMEKWDGPMESGQIVRETFGQPAGWAGPGYDGVHIFAPDGQRIGQILLPEICANLVLAEQSVTVSLWPRSQSLYAVYVEARGAHIT